MRDGAAYAKDILKALTSGNGGFGETAGAIGGVILAALQDGANYVRDQISAAFAGTAVGKVTGAFGRVQDFFRGAGSMAGALLAGASFDEAGRMGLEEEAAARAARNQPRASALDAALAKLNAVVTSRTGGGANAGGAGAAASGSAATPAVADLNAGLAAAKAKEIEDSVYDLKAVNPHKKSEVDERTPEELTDIIEAKGREIAEALLVLRGKRH